MRATWLLSPHLQGWQKEIVRDLRRRVPDRPGDTWVLSSGTQSVGQLKAIALSREAMSASAEAVNTHLKATARDRWLVALPTYHVGGYSIALRARLSRSKVFAYKGAWNTRRFVKSLDENKISLTALVPTQIFDLVRDELRAPPRLRAIVVGGGALDAGLYLRARRLGWPVLPSYGLTETASQVATAALSSLKYDVYPPLKVLPHARFELRGQRLWIKADSLGHFVARGTREGSFTLEDPRRDGWYATEDLAEPHQGGWRILGRKDEVIKILGVLLSVPQVESEVRDHFAAAGLEGHHVLLVTPHARNGHELSLVTDSTESFTRIDGVFTDYNARVPGPQRLSRWVWTERVPITDLGKVQRATLASELGL